MYVDVRNSVFNKNLLFSYPSLGGKSYVRILETNDQPLFKESLQTSRDSLESDNDFKKSRDGCPDFSKSGWSFFREFGWMCVRMYPPTNDQPLFEESVQTSRDSFGWGYNSNKSWDVRLDSPKSGVPFLSCPHGGRGKYFAGFFQLSARW